MYKIGCLLQIAIVVLFSTSCSIRSVFWPSSETIVKLPMCSAVARFQEWAGFVGSRPYMLVVETPNGTTKREMLTNWGPAESLNLYRTETDWFVVIGGGGETAVFDVCAALGPRQIWGNEFPKTDGEHWEYLGVVDSRGSLTPPKALEECIPLFGAGYTPFRKSRQAEHFCNYEMKLKRD